MYLGLCFVFIDGWFFGKTITRIRICRGGVICYYHRLSCSCSVYWGSCGCLFRLLRFAYRCILLCIVGLWCIVSGIGVRGVGLGSGRRGSLLFAFRLRNSSLNKYLTHSIHGSWLRHTEYARIRAIFRSV